MNLWSVMVLGHEAIEPGTQRVTLGNGKPPETIVGTKLKLIRTSIVMPVDDVDAVLGMNEAAGTFVVPAMTRHFRKEEPVRCAGEWVPRRALPPGESQDRNLIPWLPALAWLSERNPGKLGPRGELGDKGLRYILGALRAELGVDLLHQEDRLGAFLVAWPEDRLDMRATTDPSGTRFGGFLRVRGVDRAELSLIVQAFRGDELIAAHQLLAPATNFSLDLGTQADRYAVQVFHRTEGLLYADDAIPLRTIEMRGDAVRGSVEVGVQPRTEDGQPVGPAMEIAFHVGMPMSSHVGNVEGWERRRWATRQRMAREKLVRDGTLRIFMGPPGGRDEAVAYIRDLVASHHDGTLRIWDEYFSGNELLLIIGSLRRVGIPVQILSGEAQPPPSRQRRITYAGDLPVDVGIAAPSIADVVRGLDQVAFDVGAKHAIEHRRGSAFHDRFLITDAACYQLGSSLNSIGMSFSTVLRLPDRELLVTAFDEAWRAGVQST